MTPPRPLTIRLATQAHGAPLPSPPFGLRAWTADADAVAVLLDATQADLHDVTAIADQLPAPSAIAAGAPVVVFATAVRMPDGWRRLLGARRIAVPRAARCAALLVRGYVDIGGSPAAAATGDLAWGFAPAL
jgi:hypothetical protein